MNFHVWKNKLRNCDNICRSATSVIQIHTCAASWHCAIQSAPPNYVLIAFVSLPPAKMQILLDNIKYAFARNLRVVGEGGVQSTLFCIFNHCSKQAQILSHNKATLYAQYHAKTRKQCFSEKNLQSIWKGHFFCRVMPRVHSTLAWGTPDRSIKSWVAYIA